MTTNPLDTFIANLATHQAHALGQPIDLARAQIAHLVERALSEYRDAGAVYGDELVGFLRWLSERGLKHQVE